MMSLVNPGILCPLPYLFIITMYLSLTEILDKTETSADLGEDVESSQLKEALDELEEEKEEALN